MRVAFLVNERSEPSFEQTTTGLIASALRSGHEVGIFGAGDLSITERGDVIAKGCVLREAQAKEAIAQRVRQHFLEEMHLAEYDLWVLRTNPARDPRGLELHIAALRIAERVESDGVCVINRPRGLSRALTKLSLIDIPTELQPRTLVTRDSEQIEYFLKQVSPPAVIKPLHGTRGQNVFLVSPPSRDNNTRQIIDVVLRGGYAVVQEFVKGAERGDIRVFVVDGTILEIEGKAAAVARIPSETDFRSNLHARGKSAPASVTDEMRQAIEAISPVLKKEGIFHAGVDFVGGKILEINVFSPGGLIPSETLYGVDFTGAAFDAFERLATKGMEYT